MNDRVPAIVSHPPPAGSGLFRATVAGRGRTLLEAFDRLERAPGCIQVSRHSRRNLFGARIPIDATEGQGHWEFTRLGSKVYVIVENRTYRSTRVELVPGDDLLQFYFTLGTDLTLETGGAEPLRINRPSLLVWRQPQGLDIEEWSPAGATGRAVAITVDRRYFAEEFFSSPDEAGALESFLRDDSADLRYCQLPLTAQMFDLAARLVDHPYAGTLGLIFTEAVTHELLCLAICAIQQQPACESAPKGFSDRQLRCLHAARALLAKQMSPAPTIRDVARTAGINQTSLKRGFKALFGETLFDYSVRQRMEYAMKLLSDRSMPVSHVAEAVGYVHQTSFATAFRRHFGVCPKKIRSPTNS